MFNIQGRSTLTGSSTSASASLTQTNKLSFPPFPVVNDPGAAGRRCAAPEKHLQLQTSKEVIRKSNFQPTLHREEEVTQQRPLKICSGQLLAFSFKY